VLLVASLVLSVIASFSGCVEDEPSDGQRDCRAVGEDCTLREAAAQGNNLVGAAVRDVFDSDPQYRPALVDHFNSVTAEHAMKWDAIKPERGVFDFAAADELVEIAEAHGIAVRGHTLIWDQSLVDSTPEYVKATTSPRELRELMTEHIQTVVGRYRGRIDSWDVVNEPLETLGASLYPNVFYDHLGPGYIAEALELAHAADPDARLFINENMVCWPGPKFDVLVELVDELLDSGAPLHGVGLQGHFIMVGPTFEDLRANIEVLENMGIEVEITEVDIALRGDGDLEVRLERQRQDYYNLARACYSSSACRRVTVWGFTDRYTWVSEFFGEEDAAPLPFDESYGLKPAYYGLRDALLEAIE